MELSLYQLAVEIMKFIAMATIGVVFVRIVFYFVALIWPFKQGV